MQQSSDAKILAKNLNSIMWNHDATPSEITTIINNSYDKEVSMLLTPDQVELNTIILNNFNKLLSESEIPNKPWGPKGKEDIKPIVIGISELGVAVKRNLQYKDRMRSGHAYTSSLVGEILGKKTSASANPYIIGNELSKENIVTIQTEGLNAQIYLPICIGEKQCQKTIETIKDLNNMHFNYVYFEKIKDDIPEEDLISFVKLLTPTSFLKEKERSKKR